MKNLLAGVIFTTSLVTTAAFAQSGNTENNWVNAKYTLTSGEGFASEAGCAGTVILKRSLNPATLTDLVDLIELQGAK